MDASKVIITCKIKNAKGSNNDGQKADGLQTHSLKRQGRVQHVQPEEVQASNDVCPCKAQCMHQREASVS